MSQQPVDILKLVQEYLQAGKHLAARSLLMDYIKQNPRSEQAWWMLSFAVTEVAQQIDCLERVVALNPQNIAARNQLAALKGKPAALPPAEASPTVQPFVFDEPEESAPAIPAPLPLPMQPILEPAPEPNAAPEPPEPVEAAVETPPPPEKKSKSKWWLADILMATFVICVIALIAAYLWNQQKLAAMEASILTEQAYATGLRETLVVAQTLTSLPLPTQIPTWTPSLSPTFVPTATAQMASTLPFTSTQTPPSSDMTGPAISMYAPDFSLVDVATGEQVTLSQFSGHPVLVYFWQTKCPLCTGELTSIGTVYQTYKDAGLIVLTIDAAEGLETVSAFRASRDLTFPVLLDPDGAVQALYRVSTLPRHFFINPDGRITYIGWKAMSLTDLKLHVESILRVYPTPTP